MSYSYQTETVDLIRNLGFSDEYVVSEIVDHFMNDCQREDFFEFLLREYDLEDTFESIDDLDEFYHEAQVTASELFETLSVYLSEDELDEYYVELQKEADN